MNFTLKDYPSLAWDGVSPVPGGNPPFGPLPTPTSETIQLPLQSLIVDTRV